MGILEALGLAMRVKVEEAAAGCGLEDREGNALMSRTDPETGLALDFTTTGFCGRRTPDEERAKQLRRQR